MFEQPEHIAGKIYILVNKFIAVTKKKKTTLLAVV